MPLLDGPLAGVRILAVEQYAAGPFASQQLAALGAEVIKIEDPSLGGDVGRSVPPDGGDGDSLFFQTFNHGKRCIALDLRSSAGQEVLGSLVEVADAVLYNLRGDVPDRLGLRYATLGARNPRIVCVSLSAYGLTGPRAEEPGYDYLIQGLAGWMHLTGEPDAPPTKTGLSLVDFASGYAAVAAVLAGIIEAGRTGVGRDWDLSLYDVGVSLLTYVATWHLTLGITQGRTQLSGHPTLVPFQNFRTADGWIVVACAKEVFWQRLRDALDDPRLGDPRFDTSTSRLQHRSELLSILEARFVGETSERWLDLLGRSGVPCGPVHRLEDAFAEPQLQARGLVQRFPHDSYGEVTTIRSALIPTAEERPSQAAAALGADTDDVLASLLGWDAERLEGLREAGAFG